MIPYEVAVELNHLHSMHLMLMEAIVYEDWKGAEFYRVVSKEAIERFGKIAKVDVSTALGFMDKVKEHLERREVRPAMRLLEDAYWHTISTIIEGGGHIVQHSTSKEVHQVPACPTCLEKAVEKLCALPNVNADQCKRALELFAEGKISAEGLVLLFRDRWGVEPHEIMRAFG